MKYIYLYTHLALLFTYYHHCAWCIIWDYNVEYSHGSHSYYFEDVQVFRGYMEPLKILQLHILEVQSRPRFQTAKITMQIHPKQIWEALLFNRSCLKMTSLKMTKLTH